MAEINIFWFRRDLRLIDNAGLFNALQGDKPVLPIFIFDTHILDKLESKDDRRVDFIHAGLEEIQNKLISFGSSLIVFHDTPENAFNKLINNYKVGKVFTNHDYEPYARERDKNIGDLLASKNIHFLTFKDQVIFEKNEVLKDDLTPYTVFSPYSRKWKYLLNNKKIKFFESEKLVFNFLNHSPKDLLSLKQLGFAKKKNSFPSKELKNELVKNYSATRNFPGINGTSRLGVHLRFGTISIRHLTQYAQQLSEVYLNELIWRDFYQMILWHFPHVGKGLSFKPSYDNIEWRRDNGEFEKWCNGETGYPIVDAGMRELNTTGFMHNRVRMITASFLCKHLLLDWRLGEAYFAEKLLDYDMAANNGGWQWVSGSGCDSAPYFRIFNPTLQTKKFDPDLIYIKKWVPEFQEFKYPQPIVNHEFARKRCLEIYSEGLKKK